MAGFDITSLLNQLMGKQEQKQQTQEAGAQAPEQTQQPAGSMAAAPGGGSGSGGGAGAGGLSSLLSSGMIQKLAPMIGGLVAGGGLNKLMDQLKGGGLGSQAKSWVSAEQPNQPVSGEQITQALGHEQISQFANTLGMTNEQAAQTMATTLPQVVDAMTPEGHLPQTASAGAPGAPGASGASTAPGAENPAASPVQNRPQAGGTTEARPR